MGHLHTHTAETGKLVTAVIHTRQQETMRPQVQKGRQSDRTNFLNILTTRNESQSLVQSRGQ